MPCQIFSIMTILCVLLTIQGSYLLPENCSDIIIYLYENETNFKSYQTFPSYSLYLYMYVLIQTLKH